MGKWHANQRVILFIGAMVCLFTTPRTLANSKTETSEEANAVEMSPAIATMGINFMTTGAMVGSAWSHKASGALYDGLTVTADIHGAPQWQIIGSGLSGAAIGVGGLHQRYVSSASPI